MRLHLCGVRGSTSAPGQDFVRYGGHTSCVAVARDGQAPSLLLDAGTGLRQVPKLLDGAPFAGTILLGHLHWDHTHGLPFFGSGDHTGARVRVLVPSQGDPVEVLSRAMSPPHFPILPTELRGEWSFESLEAGRCEAEGFSVLALDIPHKGGRTFGFRVTDGRGTVAYLSDHCPVSLGPGPEGLGPYHEAALELADGADLLLHDAQYTAAELPARAAFGHSAAEYAVGLGQAAGVRRVVLFHHDPSRTDAQIDKLVESCQRPGQMAEAAAEGKTYEL